MFLTLQVDALQLAKIDRILHDIEEGICKTQDEAASGVLDLVRSAIEDRFLDEGPPLWKELAPSTQRQRAALGYGPTGPILRRTGDLMRSLTDSTDPMHIHLIRQYSSRTTGLLGTKDPRYLELQWGTELEGGNIPARWMWPGPGGQEEINLMDEIEGWLLGTLFRNAQCGKHRDMGVR